MSLTNGLCAVTEMVMAAIPGTDGVAVVVPGAAQTIRARAMQGDLPRLVAALHNEIGQGPWLDAVTAASRIRIRDARTEDRWPLFRGPATALGARGMLCVPVAIGPSAAGSLCLISGTAGTFGEQARNLAPVFAEHVAAALASAEITGRMRESLETRALIGRARGIIMERHQLTPDAAFAMLSRVARDARTTLKDAAGEVCRAGHLPEDGIPPLPGPPAQRPGFRKNLDMAPRLPTASRLGRGVAVRGARNRSRADSQQLAMSGPRPRSLRFKRKRQGRRRSWSKTGSACWQPCSWR